MMGDTSLTTVNRHYFNINDAVLAELVDGWGKRGPKLRIAS